MTDIRIYGLIYSYQHDTDSSYRKLRHHSRQSVDYLCKRLKADHGNELLSDIKARHLLRWHEEWTGAEGKKLTMAHALIGMIRTLVNFGATILECEQSERLASVMHRMRFAMAKPRNERITAEQAVAIIAKAHEHGRPSIALAQALQFECILRQKDVIGEVVPLSERGMSDVLMIGKKWLRGLRWEEIDENLILTHVTSKRQKEIVVDLKLAPLVMREFARMVALPKTGPIIVSETTRKPWTACEFRRHWRKYANEAGIPKACRNMDSRAGAISEATDAGANIEHVRQAATHSNISTTQNYSRNAVEKTLKVQQARAAHRLAKGA